MTYKQVRATVFVSVLLGTCLAGAGVAHAADSSATPSVSNSTSSDVVQINQNTDVQVTHQSSSTVTTGDNSNPPADASGTDPESVGTPSAAPETGQNAGSAQTDPTAGTNPPDATTLTTPPNVTQAFPTKAAPVFRYILPGKSGSNQALPLAQTQLPQADSRAPKPSAPASSGVMDQINAVLKSVVVPVFLRLDAPLLPATNSPGGLAGTVFVVLILTILLSASYVGQLRHSGFQHAARSDVPRAAGLRIYFATHPNVSLAWLPVRPAEGSRFNGVRNTNPNYLYQKGGE